MKETCSSRQEVDDITCSHCKNKQWCTKISARGESMPKFWFHLGAIIHSSISFAKINHLHLNYCVIYAKGGDYCKVSTSQNKANLWSIKSLHYSIT